jgi:adhesin HecA-like repeat protein
VNTTRRGVERELRKAIWTGRPVDLRTGNATADNPTHGAGWAAQRIVAAALLAELLTSTQGSRRPRALRLAGARIVGRLDLVATELVCPLLLWGCWFAEPVDLEEAQASFVGLWGCHLPGLSAEQLTTRGNLELHRGFTATGEIALAGAHIGGRLDLRGATLTNPDGPALNAARLTVDQDMFCSDGFTTRGEVVLLGAHIGGQLDLRGATLTNPDGPALNAARLTVDQDMFCSEGFTTTGEVSLIGAHIGGWLDLRGATLTNPDGPALKADGLSVDQVMVCSEGFTARGEVVLLGAHIGGQLDLRGATLTNPDGCALSADGLTVELDMFCLEEFSATGEVALSSAKIGGILDLRGATLTNPDGCALSAAGLSVDQDMVCREGFTARGEVVLLGAHIGGQLDLRGATLTNPAGRALNGQRLRAGVLILHDLTEPPGRVDLAHAQVGVLADEPASWPRQAVLYGFVYDALHEHGPISARQRLGWLARTGGYIPQPYEQLAAVYRRAGRDQDARTVAIAKQRARRPTLGLPGRVWSRLLDVLVGYGYRTWLAGVWLAGFWLVGWVVFDRAHAHHDLVLAKPGEARPAFQAVVYALDTLLPVVDLRQQDVWIPQGVAQWWAWASILAGWVLTTAVVAALTGLLKRD